MSRNVGGSGGLGPAFTRGEIEAPQGEKDMGTHTAAVYTAEQQQRLNVDESGNKKPMLCGGPGSLGPAWTRGEIEAPQGEKNMGTFTAAVYTAEQQQRLNVDETGQPQVVKDTWPELVGTNGEAAATTIQQQNSAVVEVAVMEEGGMCTSDFRLDRVRVRVDEHGNVVSAPNIG